MENKETAVNPTPEVKDESNLVARMAEANELANNPEVVKETFKYGNTPVVYMPTRAMVRPAPSPGLLDFIRRAKTVKEVENLLTRGPKFENVHPGTVRKWEKAAKKRIAELTPSTVAPKVRKTKKS